MPIVLLRVDERLIHGQVVVGWGSALHPQRIVVVDDALASEAWEQELYTMGLPDEIDTAFASVGEARDRIAAWREDPRRTIVLTRDVETMRRLADAGALSGERINIGGIHFAPGRKEVLPYVFLSSGDAAELRRLSHEGVSVSARDLPGSREVGLDQLVGRGG